MSVATGRLPLKRAWWSVALIPIGLGIALLLGESIPGFTGNGWTHDADLPSALVFALTAVAVLLVALPSASAVWYGGRALRDGERRGIAPLLVGVLALLYLALTTIGGITGAS
jgi:uncharacterized membrane protein YhaH (DUF805 family)